MKKIIVSQKYKSFKEEIDNILSLAQKRKGKIIQDKRNLTIIVETKGFNDLLVVKIFKKPSFFKRMWYTISVSKAERSFTYAQILKNKSILTPQPVAYSLEKNLFIGNSAYISEYVKEDYTFRELIHDLKIPDREHILREFTAFTFKLHENNILFKDHSPGNTLIKKSDDGYLFYLIDLNRMTFRELCLEERLKNFRKLWMSKYMVKIIADEYAKLYNSEPQYTHDVLLKYSKEFQHKKTNKKLFKKRISSLIKTFSNF